MEPPPSKRVCYTRFISRTECVLEVIEETRKAQMVEVDNVLHELKKAHHRFILFKLEDLLMVIHLGRILDLPLELVHTLCEMVIEEGTLPWCREEIFKKLN